MIRLSSAPKKFWQMAIRGLGFSAFAILLAIAASSLWQQPVASAAVPAPASDKACDRACLDGFVDQYLAALVAHDPARLPMATNPKTTETGIVVPLGEGFWKSADQIGTYQVRFADPATGEVGIIALTDEHGLPGVLALRLKVESRKISEAEAIINRQDIQGQGGALMTSTMFAVVPIAPLDRKWFLLPDPLLLLPVKAEERSSREKMIAIADAYFDGIEKSSSAGVPLDDSCIRRDNGVQTTNNPNASPVDPTNPTFHIFGLDCAQQLDSHYYSVISKVRDRRYPVLDEDRGLVYGVVMFDHPAVKLTVDVPDAGTINVPPTYRVPSSFFVPVLFKIQNGKIMRIEFLERAVAYGTPTGWKTSR
jgi:hypothetical protein